MGGKKSVINKVISDVTSTADKAIGDTVGTITKGVSDASEVVDLEGNLGKALGGTGKVVGDVGSAIGSGAAGIGNVIGGAGNLIGEGVGYLTGDKTRAGEREAKKSAKRDAEQRDRAIIDQKTAESNLRKQNASNADANKGSSIILGRKGKKGKKGGAVSSGMGLSKGKTGLQT